MQNLVYRNKRGDFEPERIVIESRDKSGWFYLKPVAGFPLEYEQEEKDLDEKMHNIRQAYIANTVRLGIPYPPSRPFAEQKATIDACPLFRKVFRPMPKGGLLHIHNAAALSPDGLLHLLEQWNDNLPPSNDDHIYVIHTQNNKQPRYLPGTLFFKRALAPTPGRGDAVDLTPYAEALDLKQPQIRAWLRGLVSLTTPRAGNVPYIWDALNEIFVRTAALLTHAGFYLEYQTAVFSELYADNIQYVELRSGFEVFDAGVLAVQDYNALDYEAILDRALMRHVDACRSDDIGAMLPFLDLMEDAAKKAAEEHPGMPPIVFKVILCARRSLNPRVAQDMEMLERKVDLAIGAKAAYPNLIIGFDFVSEEDRGETTKSYFDIIYGNREGQSNSRIQEIDFYLHAGESNWLGNENVIDAAIISRHRIGHGFNMNKFPGLVRSILCLDEPPTPIWQPTEPVTEICLISNQALRYCPDLRTHPAREMLKQGIQAVLGNDDPLAFDNPGLAYDFWEAYMALELDLKSIKRLVYNSLYYQVLNSIPPGRGEPPSDMLEAFFKKFWSERWNPFVKSALEHLNTPG
jgi:Adenosine deaminase